MTRSWPPWRQTNSRPSGANAIAVAFVRPLATSDSVNPDGRVAARLGADCVRIVIRIALAIERIGRSIAKAPCCAPGSARVVPAHDAVGRRPGDRIMKG